MEGPAVIDRRYKWRIFSLNSHRSTLNPQPSTLNRSSRFIPVFVFEAAGEEGDWEG